MVEQSATGFLIPVKTGSVKKAFCCAFLILVTGCDVDQGSLSTASELFDRGVTLFEEKSYRQAEALFTQAILLLVEDQQGTKLAETYGYLSKISLTQGQFRNALEQVTTALQHTKKANDFRGEARLNVLAGDIYRSMGDYDEALNWYNASFALSAAFDDKASKADVGMKRATTLLCMNRWEDAAKNYEGALEFYRSNDAENQAAAALIGIAEVYSRQRRYGEALGSLTQALQLVDPSEQPALEGKLYLHLGLVYRAMNDPNNALRSLRDGANRLRAKRTGKEYETLLLFCIGTLYGESGKNDEARKFYTEAISVAKATGDRLAENYLYLFVAQTTEKLLPAQQKNFELEKRIQSFVQIAQRFHECNHPTGEAFAYLQAGKLYESQEKLAEAREMYQRAVELEDERTSEFADYEFHRPYQIELGIEGDREQWYAMLAEILIRLKRPEEALRYLDKARLKTYFDALVETPIEIRNVGLKKDMEALLRKLQDQEMTQLELSGLLANRQVQVSTSQLNQLKATSLKLKDEISKLSARVTSSYANYIPFTRSAGARLNEIQALIPRGTLVVHFLPAQDQLYIFALSRSSLEVKAVPVGRERLLGLVSEYRRLLKDPNVYSGAAGEASITVMTRFAVLSPQLYEIFFRPIDSMLDRSLVIVPGRVFENFPFHALERQDRNGIVKYLVEITSVDYLSCLTSIRFKTVSGARIRDIVAMGNPTGRNWSVDYELRDIRSFFKDANVLIGFEATWENLKSPRADVLQISSEFKNDPSNGPFGLVAFSDGETLEESHDVPFPKLTELPASPVVILSNYAGQGVGLNDFHAFLLRLNGTSDIFFNAWSADRKATKFFSEFFYTHLANGLAPGDAYRQALLNLIRIQEVNHPFSWAQIFHYGIG